MILSCTEIAQQWLSDLREVIATEKLTPRLGIVLVGDNPASLRFVQKKQEAAQSLGVTVELVKLPTESSTSAVSKSVAALAQRVDGLIVQLPLPTSVASGEILDSVPASKDIDGLGAMQLAQAVRNSAGFVPATVRGILYLLEHQKVALSGARVLIVGAGQLVGRPLAVALLNYKASVLVVDKTEKRLADLSKQATIVISATGVPGTITAAHVQPKQLVLDAGFTIVDGKSRGDVDTAGVDAAGAIVTPVPGGIGALTVAGLFANLVEAVRARA